MDLKRERKTYRLQKRYIDLLEEIVTYKNSLPEYQQLNIEVGDRHIIEEAIENYHAQTFGEDVMSFVIPQMTETISNKLDLKFDRFFENMAKVSNALVMTENINKEMLGLLIQASSFDMNVVLNNKIDLLENVTTENELLYHMVEQIILKKNGLWE